ncbi:MAG TPA: hypothetical protein VN914_17655 [Polyangia bacterium]|nr:hypothetical protein [Polyangia bacterium]
MLTELHGGTVDAHSEGQGRGSTFTVRLPASPQVAVGASRTLRVSTRPRHQHLVHILPD